MSGSGRKDVEQEGLKDEFRRITRDLGAATNTVLDAGLKSVPKSNQKILEASYRVSLLTAKCSAAETIGETLIKPAAKIMAKIMIGDRAKHIFDRISLSNNSVHRRIIDMSNNVEQMLLSDISQSRYYALQVDESTDIANFANLIAFVRHEKDQEIHDDILFCQPLSGHTTGEDML
ncbi:hypothetical protein ILUMI_02075 [Ignelater luminosus]|uniref:Uncharacterized protein n=1 Tax=Ignelater luminosus TaxID=2038154 RepID=A0A8K0DD86_IGNLU|nr:hypothetical protein ILUMI_02075 [Ignelater luminosus]